MKHARKLASLLLALVMVFALATTAFADETTGSITVDNPISGQTYTAYKIFDVVYSGENYAYTIKSDSAWLTTVQSFANTENSGLTLTAANGTDGTYIVTTTTAFSAPDFAAALKAAVSGKTGTALTVADGKATATGLDLGYYFVTSTSGALCNLTTTSPSVTIHDKNDVPFDKEADATSAEVGQIVNYTITGKVPDYTGFETYTYKITDTMSNGLTFKKDVKVTVGGTDVTSACTSNYDVDGNANKFTVLVPVKSYTIGAAIKVTYSAVINENAVATKATNEAKLEYSNDPTSDETGTKTPPVPSVDIHSAKIVIDKYETGKEDTKLAGATFILYKEVTTGEGEAAVTSKLYYKWNDTDKKVEWVSDKTQATPKTTDDKGVASFNGLADGTYYLEETAAPAGYNLLTAPVTVDVTFGENTTDFTVTAKVANNTGTLLPSTGGMGTTIFYVLGSILAIGAAVLLVTKKRMNAVDR